MAITKQIFRNITSRLPVEIYREVVRAAKECGKKPAAWVRDVIIAALTDHNKKKGKK